MTDDDAAPALRHVLTAATFAELASGGGSPAVVRELWKSQWSRRLVLLRAIFDELSARPELLGGASQVERAREALRSASRHAPGQVAALLMHPQVGSWLAYTLRRHRGGATSAAPEEVDFGQVNAVILAVAAAAGQPFAARVPLRGGQVMIPQRGLARFDGCSEWDIAEAATEDGRITLRHGWQEIVVPTSMVDSDGWWSLRRVSVGSDPALTVWLDDLDPMRDLADPVSPGRLSASEVEQWTQLLADAWTILSQDHPEVAESLAAGVTSLVPLPAGDGWNTRSASTGDAFGAIMCSPPPDAVTLAVSLKHEFMHIKLGGLMHLVPMTEAGTTGLFYAPWRDDPRPLGGHLQGIYAFFGIAEFWRRQRERAEGVDAQIADFEYSYSRAQTKEALGIAHESGGLTEHGVAFLDILAEQIDSWREDAVPPTVATLTRLITDGHRAGWRIRHCHANADDVAALADTWLNGADAPTDFIAPSTVHPDPAMRHWSQARLGLARRRILAPNRYLDARGEDWGRALSLADLALFAEHYGTAAKEFTEDVAARPDDVDAWVGLGLALDARDQPGGAALLARPELVQALYQKVLAMRPLRPPSPSEMAAWIGRTLAGATTSTPAGTRWSTPPYRSPVRYGG